MKNAVIITDGGVEDAEFIYPYYRLQEAGFDVQVAIKDLAIVTGKHGYPIKPSVDTKRLVEPRYNLVVIPGGYEAPSRVRQQEGVLEFLRNMNARGKIIAAICHGPWVLVSAGILKGKRVTSYRDCQDDLINAGASYVNESVVIDGNIITAQHYRDLPRFMAKTLEEFVKKRG